MKAVIGKEPTDRTLDEQKAAAADISKNSSLPAVYAKAEAVMKARTLWSTMLTKRQYRR